MSSGDGANRLQHCACGIFVRGNCVLLAKRSKRRKRYPGVWDIVGGHQEPGEDMDQTLRRECEEEVALRPTEYTKLGTIEEPNPDVNDPHRYHIFVVTKWHGGEPQLQGDEHAEIRWFSLDETHRLDLALGEYSEFLRRALANS